MEMKRRKIFLIFFILITFIFSSKIFASISLESYCRDGYYKVPNEEVCSRAPLCGGKSYEEVAALPQPDPQLCMGATDGQRRGCKGWVPLCCYEIARTGNPIMCVGYWERLWCHPDQCRQIDQEKGRACNNGQPGICLCGHAFESWCQGLDSPKPPIPLEVRLGLPTSKPTSTPVPSAKPTSFPTPTPTPTPTPVPSAKPTSPPIPTSKPTPIPTVTPLPSLFYFPTLKQPFPTSYPIPTAKPSSFNFPFPYVNLIPKFKYEQIKTFETQLEKPLKLFKEIFLAFKNLDLMLESTINAHLNNFIRKILNQPY